MSALALQRTAPEAPANDDVVVATTILQWRKHDRSYKSPVKLHEYVAFLCAGGCGENAMTERACDAPWPHITHYAEIGTPDIIEAVRFQSAASKPLTGEAK